jgi:hypothetical protein
MSYKCEHAKIPRRFDRRVKLTEDDKQNIISLYTVNGWGVREIARWYEGKCSRRLIQFILFPERAEVARENFKRWRKENPIKKEVWRRDMKEHRRYKVKLQASGVLAFPFYCRVFYRKSDFKKSTRFCHATLREAKQQASKAALRGCYAIAGKLEGHPIAGPYSQEVKAIEYGLKNKTRRYWAERYASKKESK